MPTVSLIGESKPYQVNNGENLFIAIRDQGHELMHGCLSGNCGACRVEVHEGSEYLDQVSDQETNTLKMIKQNYKRIHGADALDKKVIRLSCLAKAAKQEGKVVMSELI